jgi:hypothetical protein
MRNIACRKSRRRAFSWYAAVLACGALFVSRPAPLRAGEADSTSATTTTERICFVFTGSRASELESCGCHELQTGGVDREAYLYEQLRKAFPHVVLIEAGAWTDPFQTPNERLKTDYLVKALRLMRFDVFNVTPYDLAFGTTYPLQLIENGVGRLISANVRSRSFDPQTGTTATKALFAPYTFLEVPRKDGRRPVRVGVIGVTHRESLDPTALQRLRSGSRSKFDYEVADLADTLKATVPEVRKQADYVIVLAHVDRAAAMQQIPQFQDVDLFVTTWNIQAYRMLLPFGKTTLVNTGFYGRYYVHAITDFDGDNRPLRVTGEMMNIASNGTTEPAIVKLLEEYREDTKNLTRQIAVAMEQSRFAGRSQCISCHSPAYLQWTRTSHNLAYATLAQKNQHYNPDCLGCHVTAHDEPDGFVDVMQTGHLVSVQCEVCHGPGRAHVKALTAMMKPDTSGTVKRPPTTADYPHLAMGTSETMCLKCHVKDHDPNFNYERDLLLVSHKNQQGPFRRQLPASATSASMTMNPLAPPPLAPRPVSAGPTGPPEPAPPPSPALSPKQWATIK